MQTRFMQEDKRHKVDDWLRSNLEDLEKQPSRDLWSEISKDVPSKKGSNKGLWSIIGGVVLVLGILFFNLPEEEVASLNDKVSVVVETERSFKKNTGKKVELIQPKNIDKEKNDKTSLAGFVLNGSFENYTPIPHKLDRKLAKKGWVKFSKVEHWETGGIPDFYHPKNNRPKMWNNTPISAHGRQDPKDGSAYIGMIAHSKDNYREYKFTQLNKPLEKGKKYDISFCVAKGSYGPAIDDFGALFTSDSIDFEVYKKGSMEIDTSYYVNTSDKFIYSSDSYESGWLQVKKTYVAKGDEKYLYLGSMLPINQVRLDKKFKITKTRSKRRHSAEYTYYFLDNVSIEEHKGGVLPF